MLNKRKSMPTAGYENLWESNPGWLDSYRRHQLDEDIMELPYAFEGDTNINSGYFRAEPGFEFVYGTFPAKIIRVIHHTNQETVAEIDKGYEQKIVHIIRGSATGFLEVEAVNAMLKHANIAHYYYDIAVFEGNKKSESEWPKMPEEYYILLDCPIFQTMTDRAISGISFFEIMKSGLEVLEGLVYAQHIPFIHGDLTPDYIFFDEKMNRFLTGGFGVNWKHVLDKPGRFPIFQPPEVRLEKLYSSSTDVYSLGLILYGLLNKGKLPDYAYDQEQNYKVFLKKYRKEYWVKPCYADDKLSDILKSACAPDIGKRYPDPGVFQEALLEYFPLDKGTAQRSLPEIRLSVHFQYPQQ